MCGALGLFAWDDEIKYLISPGIHLQGLGYKVWRFTLYGVEVTGFRGLRVGLGYRGVGFVRFRVCIAWLRVHGWFVA